MAFLCLLYFCLLIVYARPQNFGDAELVYEWKNLEFEWPSEALKEEAIANKTYIPERNIVAGIKVYGNDVYVTIPRWFWTTGHPVTLAKVVHINGQVKLRPFPTWAAQKQGDCNALQYVQGMEIDPNTGLMYVIDIGRIGDTLNLCPAKLVVYDLNAQSQVQKYELPANVASPTSNFLNDIALDYVNGRVRFAYITDAKDSRLIVFDFEKNTSVTVKHPTMGLVEKGSENLRINGQNYTIPVPLDGIAVTPDFKYVYYCSLAGFKMYQVPTASLRIGRSDGVRVLGEKLSQSGGIGHGISRLYYGALVLNAVYFWDSKTDMREQRKEINEVLMKSEVLLVRDDTTMQWPDTVAFDNKGWIWFVSNRVQVVFKNRTQGLPKEGDAFMRVWKVYVNENGYLYQADRRTEGSTLGEGNGSSPRLIFSSRVGTILFVVLCFVQVLHGAFL